MCKIILPRFNFNIERWKWNKEFRIYVSNLGHFKDENKKEIPIKINHTTGYAMILTACGCYKAAHRLVMFTWRPTVNMEDLTVDHLDHNKRNNALMNLEWVSKEENIARALRDIEKSEAITSNSVILGGVDVFDNIDAAIDFVIAKQKLAVVEGLREKIEHRIKTAIRNNKIYCGLAWKSI